MSAERTRFTWVRPPAMHLTVKFLGDFEESRTDALRQSIEEALHNRAAIEIPLQQIGAFPRQNAPRTLWVGLAKSWSESEVAQQLTASARSIDSACARFGVEPDHQPWHPHLTLARVREGEREAGRVLVGSGVFTRTLQLRPLRFDAVHLMKSELKPDGPVHTRLWTVALH